MAHCLPPVYSYVQRESAPSGHDAGWVLLSDYLLLIPLLFT